MKTRVATVEDARAISELILPLAEKYITHEFSQEGAAHLLGSMQPEAIEQYFQSGYRYHVAEESGAITGVIGMRDNNHLYHLFVSDVFQGHGIARQLWTAARKACEHEGNKGEFTVNSSKFATGMYRQFGFSQSGPPLTKHGVTAVPMKMIAGT